MGSEIVCLHKKSICRMTDAPHINAPLIEIDSPNWEQAMIDGCLIAAAPDMYEVLKSVLWDLKQRAMPDREIVEQAIAKAEGK